MTVDDQKIKRTMKQVSENFNVVVSEGERLTNLINDVLDLAKIESGRMEWHMRPYFFRMSSAAPLPVPLPYLMKKD